MDAMYENGTLFNSLHDNEKSNTRAPINLKCEYIKNPIGIDKDHPRFSWQLRWKERGQIQTAYRIIVSSDMEKAQEGIGDVWDTGVVKSGRMTNVRYFGKPLQSGKRYYWRVMSWDRYGNKSAFSNIAFFEMGLLKEDDWKGFWIGSHEKNKSPLFRKTFHPQKPIKRARAYICGLGYYEFYINGKKVGDHVLSPAWTDYDDREIKDLLYPFDDQTTKRVPYLTYDITEYIFEKENALGVMLGNGWYNQRERNVEGKLWYGYPKFILQVNIKYEDGTQDSIVSDDSWVTCAGPIIFNNIYYGEVYDANLEVDKWNEIGCKYEGWKKAEIVKAPSGRMVSQVSPPDRVIASIKPVKVTNPKRGVYVFDMGQNFSGWIRLTVTGPKGTRVTMRFAEEAGSDGMLDFDSAGGTQQIQKDVYILKGEEVEVYEPRFTWHGFRYVEITGYPGEPKPEDVLGRVVNSDVEIVGQFECSNPMINQIQKNYVWTQLSNLHGGVPGDCPHRERLGYTGDGHVTAEACMLNFDMATFYTKWLDDISDAQNKKTGFVPHTAPFYGGGGGPAWGCAYIIIAWYMYLYYEDTEVLKDHYDGMKMWIEYLTSRTDGDYIVHREEPGSWFLGDWCTPDEISLPPELVSTYYYYIVADIMARVADILNHDHDAEYFRKLCQRISEAFNVQFFDEANMKYSIGRQGANVFPLAADIVPDEYKLDLLDSLIKDIICRGYRFDTGIFATPLTIKVLTDHGREDIAYKMLTNCTYPGYGYMIAKGATTLWENWNGQASHNHPMFGSVSAWFYKTLAGINIDCRYPGFERIVFKPCFLEELDWAKASMNTIRGKVFIGWKRVGNDLKVILEIPVNCSARLYLPESCATNKAIYESNTLVWDNGRFYGIAGIVSSGKERGNMYLDMGSGLYHFDIKARDV